MILVYFHLEAQADLQVFAPEVRQFLVQELLMLNHCTLAGSMAEQYLQVMPALPQITPSHQSEEALEVMIVPPEQYLVLEVVAGE
jgi:hypothetical protein